MRTTARPRSRAFPLADLAAVLDLIAGMDALAAFHLTRRP